MSEKDLKEIEARLNKMNKEELKELAKVTLIEREMKKVRNKRYYENRKKREREQNV